MRRHARKGKGIDEIIANLPASVDLPIAKPAIDNALNQVIGKLSAALQNWNFPSTMKYEETITEVLTPSQITAFLSTIRSFEDFSQFDYLAGMTLHKLLVNSYNAGYNDFHLDFVDEFDSVGSSLRGTAQRPIKLTVKNAGDWFLHNSEYVDCMAEKINKHAVAMGLYNSRLHIKGIVQGHVGDYAQNCFFHLEKVHDFKNFGANGCTFVINQMTGDCEEMSRPMKLKHYKKWYQETGRSPPDDSNTYKTTSLDTLALFLEYVPERNLVLFDEQVLLKYAPKKNLIYFIHPNGQEVLVE